MRIAFVVVVLIALAPGCGAEDSRLSSAELKVERVATADPVAGPVLHGDFVAWAEGGEREGAKRAPLVVFSAKPGEPRHILHRQGITDPTCLVDRRVPRVAAARLVSPALAGVRLPTGLGPDVFRQPR